MSQVVVLGAGGHGWKSLSEFILQTKSSIKFYYLSSDWGGFTGLFGRVLEFDSNNKQLHGKNLPVLAFGDINKLVDYFLFKKYGQDLSWRFDFGDRTVISKIEEFCALLSFDSAEFVNYYQKLSDLIVNYLKLFPEQKCRGCIGNFWHQFLLFKFGSLEMINAFYHSKEIIPDNLQVFFCHTNRQVMTAKDVDGLILQGEDNIDIYHKPLIPSSIQVSNRQISSRFLRDLKLADFVILPHGSIYNWLPLINCSQVIKLIKQKQVFSLMNLFYLPNELEYFEYMNYLFDLGVCPLVIGPKIRHLVFDQKILNKYSRQKKRQNIVQNLSHNNYFGSLEIITEKNSQIEGIKHCPKSVAQTLNMFID